MPSESTLNMPGIRKSIVAALLSVVGILLINKTFSDPEPTQPYIWWLLEGPPSADDSRVLEVLKEHFLDAPSPLPYNLTKGYLHEKESHAFTWPWIHSWLRTLFADQRSGFFVEAGALNGEYLSNTLWLERDLGWSGLLVEADASSYKDLRLKHRKAWSSNTCLSSKPYPKRTVFVSSFRLDSQFKGPDFSRWAYKGHSYELRDDVKQSTGTPKSYSIAQCFPLLSYLTALNVTQVDLLSLDTQGSEADILRSFLGAGDVKTRVIVAENEFGKFDDEMMKFMEKNGYTLLAADIDLIFVREDDPLWQLNALRDTKLTKGRILKDTENTKGRSVGR